MLATFEKVVRFRLKKFGSFPMTYKFSTIPQNSEVNKSQKICRNKKALFGQPTSSTHPHLVKPGEITPGISLDEFKTRRSKLCEKILSEKYSSKNLSSTHILIIPSSSKVYMSDKIPYVFRQNTDFNYFTGCQEPDSILVLTINPNNNYKSTIFMQKKDERSELWDGPRTGVEAATKLFNIDESLDVSDFESFMTSFINANKNNCTIWYDNKNIISQDIHKKLNQIIKKTKLDVILTPETLFHQLRVVKSSSEINIMKQSCEIASAAISKTIEIGKPGISEHQLFATVDYESRMRGAEFLAYPPVVAAGDNANIIHYITNNQIIKNGDTVLMDAGCEYHGYSSDITRTWPIDGKFTDYQRVLYEVVLDVQKTLIKRLENFPSLDQLFNEMCMLLGKRLQEINLIPKNFNDNELRSAAYSYCPHHVGHYLGMDVHDCGKISRGVQVEPGMIITVEPGVYVNSKNHLAPPEFHGLGIRIEDDVLITEQGPDVLTKMCPKEIQDIEDLAKRNLD
ncbi:hypothetical protein HCN44_008644 [Aphidius gifuensis]|uniref:Aminopeptidase P N-terminal domain-containing protein n=1 Tax=Aphidius gifuensis TaxID=684658 RepID=A0A834XMU2_APHGI|nr:xaa-Pro aminopeptidase 3-like [Aphidius gifuensis]KAF7989970.1 hypothetical protein HCN44_008644 [Aphidius gifuensis]